MNIEYSKYHKNKIYFYLLIFLLLLSFFSCTYFQESDKKPNIVLIVADDLGFDDVNCYNPKSGIPTPNLDKLAREGMRFTDAYSAAPICSPTRAVSARS